MNKKIVVILCVVLLLLEGAICLLADQEAVLTEKTDNYRLTEPQVPESQTNPCGEGNGGGGDPG